MKCYYHNNKNSVSQCSNCSKFLCKTCSDDFTYDWVIFCKDCFNKINDQITEWKEKERKTIKVNLILIVVLWFSLMIWASVPQVWSLVWFYAVSVLIYLRKNIPLPQLLLEWGRMFWIIILLVYISWGIIYLFIIYPFRYWKLLLIKENRKLLKILWWLLLTGLIFLLVTWIWDFKENIKWEENNVSNTVESNNIQEISNDEIINNFKELIKEEKDFKYFKNVELTKVEFYLKWIWLKELKKFNWVKQYEYETNITQRLLFMYFEKNDEKGDEITFNFLNKFNLDWNDSYLYWVKWWDNIYWYMVISENNLYLLDK